MFLLPHQPAPEVKIKTKSQDPECALSSWNAPPFFSFTWLTPARAPKPSVDLSPTSDLSP